MIYFSLSIETWLSNAEQNKFIAKHYRYIICNYQQIEVKLLDSAGFQGIDFVPNITNDSAPVVLIRVSGNL